MYEQWIAVARGLKCLSMSTTFNIIAFWVAVTAAFFLFLQTNMGPRGANIPPGWLFLPAGILAAVAFVSSRLGRFLLMRVPASVPTAKLYATAGFVLGLIGQTALGIMVFLWAVKVPGAGQHSNTLGGVFLVFTVAGGAAFHQLLIQVAHYLEHHDAVGGLTGCRVLTYIGGGLLAVCGAILRDPMYMGELIIVLAAFGLGGFLALGIATMLYSSAVRSLRFAALRQAVRAGETGFGT
jgi:hypothetical protein